MKREFYVPNNQYLIKIGKGYEIDILDVEIIINLHNKTINAISGSFKINFKNEVLTNYQFSINDVIEIGEIKIHFDEINVLLIEGNVKVNEAILYLKQYVDNGYDEFPNYYSSPCIFKNETIEKIKLELPPEKNKKVDKSELFKKMIPSIISIVIAIIMLRVNPRGVRGILMLVGTLTGFIISTVSLISMRIESRRFNKKRTEVYQNYILETRIKIVKAKTIQLKNANYNNLSFSQIVFEVLNNTSRLYERDSSNNYFLNMRIGTTSVVGDYKLENPTDKLKLERESLEFDLEEVYKQYVEIENYPLTINANYNCAMCGEGNSRRQMIMNIIYNIVFYTSYLDVNMVIISSDSCFEFVKDLKHFQNPYTKFNNIIDNATSRDQLLNSYVQILRNRSEIDKPQKFSPHLVFIIEDYKLISNHQIMEFLEKDNHKLGFSLIYSVAREDELPSFIETIMFLKANSGTLILNEKIHVNNEFKLDEINLNSGYQISKKIGRLNHIKGISSSIPNQLGFLEMFDVTKVEDLQISKRWEENKAYNSLKALLGKKSKTDFIYLDLHEKFHGPHGLIAGTTGSGKSEVIQTYILSLALNYSPHYVGFLLIDYKGGGMANLFEDMPHHLGSITNLDGYQSMRALASIKSELKRRQLIFSELKINHINEYHKMFERKEQTNPLPHLFLISDEFAELKSEQPDFMKELISAARIGRSLGIHLILATQKPSGVVDDQIWSNSKFKLCLKVAEEVDSKELLKTPDAAYITQAGRGYLKVGTNEMYELFQSGYSGKDYGEVEDDMRDRRIFEIDKYGQQSLLNPEVVKKVDDLAKNDSELDVVIEHIKQTYEKLNLCSVDKPWLAPLKEVEIKQLNYDLIEGDLSYILKVGIVDLPDEQKQIEYEIDFENLNNMIVSSAPNLGKTTTLKMMLLRLSSQVSSEMIKYYIIDFSSGSMQALKNLNHTADYMRGYDEIKIKKLFNIINDEMMKRKKLFSKLDVTSLKMYNQKAKDKLQRIYLVIDNYEMTKESELDFDEFLISIIRECVSLGIHLIMTSNRVSSIKSKIFDCIETKITLYPMDKSEVTTSVGRTDIELTENALRGFVLITKPEVIQIYVLYKYIDEQEDIKMLSDIVGSINELNPVVNLEIPLISKNVIMKKGYIKSDKMFIGIDYEYVKPFYITHLENLIICGQPKFGKTNLLKLIIESIIFKNEVVIFDTFKNELINYSKSSKYLYTSEQLLEYCQELQKAPSVIVINKFDIFEGLDRKATPIVMDVLTQLVRMDVKFIIESEEPFKISSGFATALKKIENYICVGNINKQRYFSDLGNFKKDLYTQTDCYYKTANNVMKLKTPEFTTSNFEEITLKQFNVNNLSEDKFIYHDQEIKLATMFVTGIHKDEFLETLVNRYKLINYKIDLFSEEAKFGLNNSKLTNYNPTDLENRILIIYDNYEVTQTNIKLRVEKLDNIYNLMLNGLIVLICYEKKISVVNEYSKYLKKQVTNALITSNKNEYKFIKVSSEFRNEEHKENTMYYIKNNKTIKIRRNDEH